MADRRIRDKVLTETSLLEAYLFDKHRTNPQWRRARLGPLPSKELARAYLITLRWADGIVLHKGVVRIIEAKLNNPPGVLSQLELYKKLFPQTLEFSEWKEWPIEMVILTPVLDLALMELASEKNITYVHYPIEEINRVRHEMLRPDLGIEERR